MLLRPGKAPLFLLAALLCGLLMASCESKDQECYEPVLVRVSNAFVVTDTQTIKVPIGDSIQTKDSLIRVYRDSAMLNAEMKILDEDKPFTVTGTEQADRVMRIALNPDKDSTRYTFRADTTAGSLIDTITFYYVPIVHFISNSCGYNYYYTLSDVKFTQKLFDSVAMLNTNVTNDIKIRNVQLYFRKKF
jgi:hypothetical protein